MPTRIYFREINRPASIVVSESLDTVEAMLKQEEKLNGVGVLTDYESREFDKRVIIYLRNVMYARAERVSI